MSALYNEPAELAILGGILLDNTCLWRVHRLLSKEDFYKEAHGEIFDAMLAVWGRDEAIDCITLRAELERRSRLRAVGGDELLLDLPSYCPSPELVEGHAKIVRTAAASRTMRDLALKAAAAAERGDDPKAQMYLSEALKVRPGFEDSYSSGSDAMRYAVEEYITKPRDQSRMLKLGLPSLDRSVSWVGPGHLIIIGAHPNVGKSSICLSMAKNQALAGKSPGIISLEDPKDLWGAKLLADELGLNPMAIADGHMSQEDAARAREVMTSPLMQRMHFAFETNATTQVAIAAMNRLAEDKGCDIIYLDYLQRIRLPNGEWRTGYAGALQALKDEAKRLKVPLVVTSQLRRMEYATRDEEPTISMLMETSTMDHMAEVILLLWRKTGAHEVNCRVAKLKGRPAGCLFQLQRIGGMLQEPESVEPDF